MKNNKENQIIEGSNLKIGDVVKLNNGSHVSASQEMTVINKTEEEITFFRPYVNLSNFTYTGGAIPYIGIEKFTVFLPNSNTYIIIDNIYKEKE